MQSTPKIVDAKENLSFGWIYTSRKDYGRNWFKVIDLPDYSKEERELDNKIIKCICQSSKKSNEFYFVNYQKDESRNIEFSLRQPLINDHLLRRINHIGIVDFEAMYSAIDNLKNSKFSDEAVISKWFEEELSSSQSALAYHCGNDNIHVFASDSKFGREDDKWIDRQRNPLLSGDRARFSI
ncbi:MAG: hypothetical protein IE928_05555 [Gammaproteobacteria bacterium]|nr:hypothetical protein [Gammaproteobacteria bacterium]